MAKSAAAADRLPPDVSFKDAARSALVAHLDKMMANFEGTRAGENIESLHQMRVGSRRLRAALSVFAKIFSKAEYQALDKQVGDITDALGAVRDLDVQLDHLRGVRDPLPPNEAYGLTRLIERLSAQRDKRRKKLVKALDRLEKDKFATRFQKTLDRVVPPPAAPEQAPEVIASAVAATGNASGKQRRRRSSSSISTSSSASDGDKGKSDKGKKGAD